MKSYKCCNCSNTLRPQGPVQALVQHGIHTYELNIKLDESGKLSEHTLSQIVNRPEQASGIVRIQLSEDVQGTEGSFKFQNLELTVPHARSMSQIEHRITICCSVCKRCCEYED